jgi:uncharacterized protein (TIGR01777 family)
VSNVGTKKDVELAMGVFYYVLRGAQRGLLVAGFPGEEWVMAQANHIVVTGGTGYVGQALVRRLAARGHEVLVLSRSPRLPAELAAVARVRGAAWDPNAVGEWSAELEGARAVVHLAGRKAVGARYTARVKRDIFESRVKSTEVLVEALSRARTKPHVFLCASGVGYFGGKPDDHPPLDESAPPGDDFLAHVCVEWEARARRAEALGLRVVSSRFGAVLGRGGGALAVMALPYELMGGGPLGTGRQLFSWVHLEDALSALEFALDDARVSGPVNVAAPNTPSFAEASKALGRALRRPSWLPVPSFALKALYGEGALPLITGQRAFPAKLLGLGFKFRYPTLAEALIEACS